MISIIIPFKDKKELLNNCVSSILNKTSYTDFEIILVDNNSSNKGTLDLLEILNKNNKIRILNYKNTFNFSAINNFSAKDAKGEYLIFLNNDTEVISKSWLEEMLKCFEYDKVGAVGAELFYPNGTIQHVGVMLEEKRLAIHAFRTWNEADIDFNEPREWSAVSAACMMTKKDLFLKLGGFDDKNLAVAYNDVDYCLRLREKGYRILSTPNSKLYHFESVSRKSDIWSRILNRNRYKQFINEQAYMRKRWKNQIGNDQFYKKEYIKKTD